MQAAETNAQMMQGLGQDIGGAIAGLAGSYAEGKALEAKGVAYGDFLKSHGQQLGFQPDYLESLLKKKPRELAMIGDNLVGLGGGGGGNRLMSLNHLNRQAELYPGRGGGGGGAGGGQPFMTVP